MYCDCRARASKCSLIAPHPPRMLGVIVHHLAEWQAHAVIDVPDPQAFWIPAVQQTYIRSIVVAPSAAKGRFQWPSHREDMKDWQYPAWTMRAYELDFGSK